MQQAFAAAQAKGVCLNEGAILVCQYLQAGLVDELHLVMTNKLPGPGERVFKATDNIARDYKCVQTVRSEMLTHIVSSRKSDLNTALFTQHNLV